MKLQLDVAKQEYDDAQSRYATIRNISIAAVALGVLLAVVIGFLLIRAIVRPLNAAIGYFEEIGKGNYKSEIKVESRDETGKVLEALKAMQQKLDADITEANRVANENLRIKNALDKVASNVMMADANFNIIYMNKTVTAMMNRNEAELKKVLPQFDSRKTGRREHRRVPQEPGAPARDAGEPAQHLQDADQGGRPDLRAGGQPGDRCQGRAPGHGGGVE